MEAGQCFLSDSAPLAENLIVAKEIDDFASPLTNQRKKKKMV
jgi:hypothetical protein